MSTQVSFAKQLTSPPTVTDGQLLFEKISDTQYLLKLGDSTSWRQVFAPFVIGDANGTGVQVGLSTSDDPKWTKPEATAIGALALGRGCKAYGEFSVAVGKECITGTNPITTDTTGGQFAGGRNNTAAYNNTFVWGDNSGAYGAGATSFGYNNNTYGGTAFTAGQGNINRGLRTLTLGDNNRFNESADYSAMIGRNNYCTNEGSQFYMFGVANFVGNSGNSSATLLGNGNGITGSASGTYGYMLGRDNRINEGQLLNTVLVGYANQVNAASQDSILVGTSNSTSTSLDHVYIYGRTNKVNYSAKDTVLIGVSNEVTSAAGGAASSYAVGILNKFNNDGSRTNTNGSVRNLYMGAFGGYNTVGAQAGLALGNDNIVNHERSQVLGHHLTTNANDTTVVGKFNAPSTAQFTVGSGTAENNRANCFTTGGIGANSYITIGDLTLTRNQLQSLLNLI